MLGSRRVRPRLSGRHRSVFGSVPLSSLAPDAVADNHALNCSVAAVTEPWSAAPLTSPEASIRTFKSSPSTQARTTTTHQRGSGMPAV
jgi:hypothetical protein